MSKIGEIIANNIQDIWFDFYARLLPGCYAMVGYAFIKGDSHKILEVFAGHFFIILCVGYLLGHLVQPFSSRLGQCAIELTGNKLSARSWREYHREYNAPKAEMDRFALLIEKSYSETVGMAAIFLFSIGLFIWPKAAVPGSFDAERHWIMVFAIWGSGVGALARGCATNSKVTRHYGRIAQS